MVILSVKIKLIGKNCNTIWLTFSYIFPLKYVMEHQENDPLVRGSGNKGAGGFCPFACIKSGDWGSSEYQYYYSSMTLDDLFITYFQWRINGTIIILANEQIG